MSDTALVIAEERRTTPVELLWDLVFVFAITVTTLLWREPTWAGFGRSMLVLALVWWAWSAFVWAANAQTAASPTLRACLLVSAISIFISGLSLPHAFGSEGTLFAVSYAIVRFLHLALYADASRKGNAAWSALYLVGTTAFSLRLLGVAPYRQLVVADALLVLYAVGGAMPAWVVAGAVAGLFGVLCAAESEALRRVSGSEAGEASNTADERMTG